jgi:ribose 5-phosphate isomerase
VLEVTVDSTDEVDPNLDLIKGYGRALVREKIVVASSRRLVILVGEEKLVPCLGSRGKLPVEVVPFGLPLCARALCPGDATASGSCRRTRPLTVTVVSAAACRSAARGVVAEHS